MKKLLLLTLFLPLYISLKAQLLDATANANGASTFTITTTHPNELIMIAYDGWNGPGSGPVKVDGNPATLLTTANTGNSGTAMTYYYPAAAAAVHTIVCTETGYNYAPYGINFAASVYATGCTLNGGSITASTISLIACTTGGSVTGTITTTVNKEFIYENCEINEGQPTAYPISFSCTSGLIADVHEGDGIDAAHGYEYACVPATYTVTATNTSPTANGCGGLCLILTAISGGACPPATCTGCPVVLPIELLSFGCENSTDNNGMLLSWSTATETSSDHFTIERSDNGVDFIPIVNVPAAGNSTSPRNYSYTDQMPLYGTNYYRLTETDKDGNEQRFHTSTCNYDNTNTEVYPNPNHGNFTISLGASTSYQSVVVTDMLGKQVFEQQFEPMSYPNTYTINLPASCKGVYVLKITGNDKVIAIKKLAIY